MEREKLGSGNLHECLRFVIYLFLEGNALGHKEGSALGHNSTSLNEYFSKESNIVFSITVITINLDHHICSKVNARAAAHALPHPDHCVTSIYRACTH